MNLEELHTVESVDKFSFLQRMDEILANPTENMDTNVGKARHTIGTICQELGNAIYLNQINGEEVIVKLVKKLKCEATQKFQDNNSVTTEAIEQTIARFMLKLQMGGKLSKLYMI